MVMVGPLAAGAALLVAVAALLGLALGVPELLHPAVTPTIRPSAATITLNFDIAFPIRWWSAMDTMAEVIRFSAS
jgi:hypothetical protein